MTATPFVGNAVAQCAQAFSGLQSVSTQVALWGQVVCELGARGTQVGSADQTTSPQAFKTEQGQCERANDIVEV